MVSSSAALPCSRALAASASSFTISIDAGDLDARC
jgi:hypothetical protein